MVRRKGREGGERGKGLEIKVEGGRRRRGRRRRRDRRHGGSGGYSWVRESRGPFWEKIPRVS